MSFLKASITGSGSRETVEPKRVLATATNLPLPANKMGPMAAPRRHGSGDIRGSLARGQPAARGSGKRGDPLGRGWAQACAPRSLLAFVGWVLLGSPGASTSGGPHPSLILPLTPSHAVR
jgi:hypothetical protein